MTIYHSTRGKNLRPFIDFEYFIVYRKGIQSAQKVAKSENIVNSGELNRYIYLEVDLAEYDENIHHPCNSKIIFGGRWDLAVVLLAFTTDPLGLHVVLFYDILETEPQLNEWYRTK